MMKLLKRVGLLLSLAGLGGCGGNGDAATKATTPAAQARALEDSVIAHHDRLMARMGRLDALKTQLTAAKVPAQAPVLGQLDAANRGMMGWMHQYQAPDSAAPAPQRLTYLRGQQQQLVAVEKAMQAAFDSAQATLRRAGR